ncbi:Swi5-domain-containing protein [Hyaloscypha hepaticicola]|uniref:Swi5-domain-containing protein n=1 Tax=Hyaloscypha hepaticicola TaxID=2082293 RepID=A0A2J6QDN6_9HELO|nr:Swi5-domain-containing protein [Hyaloscypha hepaticicola]
MQGPWKHLLRCLSALRQLLQKELLLQPREYSVNEMVPTISDVNDRRETPKILKNFTAIPDSDDEEGDEPDAQVLGLSQPPALDTQLPAFPHQAFRNEGTPKAATFQSASNVPIEEQGQRGGDTTTTASLAALKGANSPTVTIASSDITSSISMAAVEPPSKKHAATQPLASMEQSIQGTEVKQAIELPSSLTDVQARAMPRTTSITQESSQATDTPSSPLQLMRRESSAAKKRELPPASFIVPEALQSKDVLMAELKAMKIASIQNRISALEAEIATKRAKLDEVVKGLKQPAAETVKNHIKLLHDYNDIRDVGQGLIGMIADNRGVRVGELYAEFGVGLQD